MHLAEISNHKHLQKSNDCLKLYFKDNMRLCKSELSLQNSLSPYFRRKLKSIHSRQIEVKKLYIIPNTQLNFRDCIVTDRCNLQEIFKCKKGQKDMIIPSLEYKIR